MIWWHCVFLYVMSSRWSGSGGARAHKHRHTDQGAFQCLMAVNDYAIRPVSHGAQEVMLEGLLPRLMGVPLVGVKQPAPWPPNSVLDHTTRACLWGQLQSLCCFALSYVLHREVVMATHLCFVGPWLRLSYASPWNALELTLCSSIPWLQFAMKCPKV